MKNDYKWKEGREKKIRVRSRKRKSTQRTKERKE